MSLLEDFIDLCEENDFDNIESNSFAMQCDIRSFEHRYRLTAEMAASRLLVRLSDLSLRMEPTPEVLEFLKRVVRRDRCVRGIVNPLKEEA